MLIINIFSQYRSGITSSLFALKVTRDVSEMVRKIDLMIRLGKRHIATPEEYENVSYLFTPYLTPKSGRSHAKLRIMQAYALRLKAYGSKGF